MVKTKDAVDTNDRKKELDELLNKSLDDVVKVIKKEKQVKWKQNKKNNPKRKKKKKSLFPGPFPPQHSPFPPTPSAIPTHLNPVEVLHQIVQKFNLNPSIAVLDTRLVEDNQAMEVQIDMDCSELEGKPAGSFVLRQTAWGVSKKQAKAKAVSELLKHPILQSLYQRLKMKGKQKKKKAAGDQKILSSEPLFPGLAKRKEKKTEA